MSIRIVASGKVRAVDAEAGTMEFVVSTDKVARDGMIIRKQAWKGSIARAAENEQFLPKFTIAHMHGPLADGSPPVLGTGIHPRWVEGEGLVVGVRWADEKIQPAVKFWRRGYEKGFLTDVSVEWGNSKFAEGADRQSDVPEIVDLTWDAFSACVIGADEGAKKRAAAAGDAEFVRMLEAEQARAVKPAETRAVVPPVAIEPSTAAAPPVTPDAQRLDRGVFIGATATGERNVIKDYAGCPAGKPWAVVAKHDGKLVDSFATEAEARAAAGPTTATPVAPVGGVVLDGHVEIKPGGGITVDPAGGVPALDPPLTAREVVDALKGPLVDALARLELAERAREAAHVALVAEVRGALEELRAAKAAPLGEAAGTPPSADGHSAADAEVREGGSVFDHFLEGVGDMRRAAHSINEKVAAASR